MQNENLNLLSEKVIACAIEVHRHLGPGLLESIYEKALCFEFKLQGIIFQQQVNIPIKYKGEIIGDHRLELLVEDKIIVEIKAVNKIQPVFMAQLLSYLKLTNKKLGLLINFNVPVLYKGVKRIVL